MDGAAIPTLGGILSHKNFSGPLEFDECDVLVTQHAQMKGNNDKAAQKMAHQGVKMARNDHFQHLFLDHGW